MSAPIATLGATMKVEVVRSPRRRKTITAEQHGDRVVVRLPAGLTRAEERTWVDTMVARMAERQRIERLNAPRDLEARARRLNDRHFGGRLRWRSIAYVGNQRDRFGSCTPEHGTIRISDRVAEMPPWVRDYVVMHELAHLETPNHSPRFWRQVGRLPLAERARGFLMAQGMDE
jgi:predicted metal-dependent hydrolase